MENKTENQECVQAPEKKKGVLRVIGKIMKTSLILVGIGTVAYLADEKFCKGKGRKFLADKCGDIMSGKIHKEDESEADVKPAVTEVVFEEAAVVEPTRAPKREWYPKKEYRNNNYTQHKGE